MHKKTSPLVDIWQTLLSIFFFLFKKRGFLTLTGVDKTSGTKEERKLKDKKEWRIKKRQIIKKRNIYFVNTSVCKIVQLER